MAGGNVTPQSWAHSLLGALGAPTTPQNVQAVVGWEGAEGGHWHNSATYNPLNTTQPAPGAGNTGSQGNIKQYTSWQQGLNATVQTLRNGYYASILAALHAGNNPQAVASAIGGSKWGTNGSLVSQTIRDAAGQTGGGGALVPGAATPTLGTTPGMKSSVGTGRTFNQSAFDAASAKAIAGAYLSTATDPYKIPLPKTGLSPGGLSTGLPSGPQSNPLLTMGVLPTTAPDPANFYHAAQQSLQKLAGNGTPLNQHPAAFAAALKGSGYVNPIPHATIGRTDQGVDANLPVGAPIRAIGNAKVIGVLPDWYGGQPLVWYQLLDGPAKGKYVYVAEQINSLAKPGSIVPRGGVIARYAPSGTGIETGWATSSGQTMARVTSGYSEGEVTPSGQNFRNFLNSLGA